MKQSNTELDRLKSLLLADELALLEELASKVEHLEFETLDKEAIKQKLLPLFDDLLLEKLQMSESRTVEIFSEYLAQIISQSVARDPQKLSRALQDVISPAIAQGIADNKEKMIDALYPIMGGMISKYVTQAIKEMMETINKKIEQGFSVERYKRKLKAKLTGVSESELLLEESTDAHIAAMFVIHKETGLLVSEAHLENSHIGDPHMVASMASAIKDFINDWIADNQSETNEIQILSYGNATLYIESAGSVYIIAFLDSEPDYEQRSEINAFFASLLKEYVDFFQSFDGDDSSKEVGELSEKMYAYLAEQPDLPDTRTPGKKRRNPAKFIFFALGIGVLLYVAYTLKEHYDIYLLEQQIIAKTGEEIRVEKESNGLYLLEGALDDPSHYQQIVKIAQAHYPDEKIEPHLYLSVEGIERSKKRVVQQVEEAQTKVLKEQQDLFSQQLSVLKKDAERKYAALLERQERIQKQLNAISEKRAKLQRLIGMKDRVAAALLKTMKNDPYYDAKHQMLNFAPLHLFEEGKPDPSPEKMAILKHAFEKYVKALLPYKAYIRHITVSSFSDTTGDAQSNLALTQVRASKVASYLHTLPVVRESGLDKLLVSKGKGESAPVIIHGEEDHDASRRIVIGFELDKKKLDAELAQLLH